MAWFFFKQVSLRSRAFFRISNVAIFIMVACMSLHGSLYGSFYQVTVLFRVRTEHKSPQLIMVLNSRCAIYFLNFFTKNWYVSTVSTKFLIFRLYRLRFGIFRFYRPKFAMFRLSRPKKKFDFV